MSTSAAEFPAIAPLDVAGEVAPPSAPVPSLTVAQYDPSTGRYLGPDGHVYQQSDLVAPSSAKTWQDMLPK